MNELELGPKSFKRCGECAVRTIGDETILVPIRSHVAELESVYVTNEVGRAIWEMLSSSQTIDAITAHLVEAFEVTDTEARNDAAEFIRDLLEVRLVAEDSAGR